MVLGYPPKGLVCDHINNDPLDNRRCNLQFITNRENSTKDTKNKGLWYRERDGVWYVQIVKNKKQIFLGHFNTEQDARDQHNRALAIIDTCTKEDLINLRNKYKRENGVLL